MEIKKQRKGKDMPQLSVMIKPASGRCDLRCRYCFYRDEIEKRSVSDFGMMSDETLEALVRQILSEATGSCSFAFQGGEPTLAGLDFYRKLIEFQKKYNISNCKIHNAIQTNGMHLDEEWAEFLKKNDFLVGLSFDGTPELHDMNRIDAGGKDTANRVLKTAKLLEKYDVPFNILCVVGSAAAKHAGKVYRYLTKQGFDYLQFIPCLDPYGEPRGERDYSLTPQQYSQFLKTVFDLWYKDVKSGRQISVRTFDNWAGMLAGYPPEACGMMGRCQCQFVVEADGSVYPCDFYVFDEYKLGNVKTDSFRAMFESEAAKNFVKPSYEHDPECSGCRWFRLCRGGCRRDRDDGGKIGRNYYCESYKAFFEYAAPRLAELAAMFG